MVRIIMNGEEGIWIVGPKMMGYIGVDEEGPATRKEGKIVEHHGQE